MSGGTLMSMVRVLLMMTVVFQATAVRAESWQMSAPMLEPRCGAGGAVVGEVFVLLGGSGNAESCFGPPSDVVQVYEPQTNEWRIGPAMNRARAFPLVAVVENVLYVIGGESALGTGQS